MIRVLIYVSGKDIHNLKPALSNGETGSTGDLTNRFGLQYNNYNYDWQCQADCVSRKN